MIEVVAVVVPACDEQARIARCLSSVAGALDTARVAGCRGLCVVAADACVDATVVHARRAMPDVEIVELDARCVGAARRAGAARALEMLGQCDPATVWLAATDADCAVPADWLTVHLAAATEGADAIAGLVEVDDWLGRPTSLQRRFAAYTRRTGNGSGHPHVHGANLGVCALAYGAAGGWPALASGEDVALWKALGRTGARRRSVDGGTVLTSGRTEARARAGFARFLTALEAGQEGEPVEARLA